MSYIEQRAYADGHNPAVMQILAPFVGMEVLKIAPPHLDMNCATDFHVYQTTSLTIASRVRTKRSAGRYLNDFTIRCRVYSGQPTEYHKIYNGFGHWMFYGIEDAGSIYRWIIIDLEAFRYHLRNNTTVVLPNSVKENGDGSAFLPFNFLTFWRLGAPNILKYCSPDVVTELHSLSPRANP